MIAPALSPGQNGAVPGFGSAASPTQQRPNGGPNLLAEDTLTGTLPFTPSSVFSGRPSLPDDLVVPHNSFAIVEEGEKAIFHLLRKAGVDVT